MDLPATVMHESHPHPLEFCHRVYDGWYGCDVCHDDGVGCVFRCRECGFDVHPQCAIARVQTDHPAAVGDNIEHSPSTAAP